MRRSRSLRPTSLPWLPLAPVLARPSLRSSLAVAFGDSSLAAILTRDRLRVFIRDVPPLLAGRRRPAAAASTARTRRPSRSCRCGPGRPARRLPYPAPAGVSRTQIRRRRTTSDTSRPAIIVSANTSTHTCAGSWDTCTLMNGTAPSNRTTVPSSSRVSWPARRLTRAFLVSRFCSMSRGSSENNDCGRPVSRPVSPR